MQDLVRVAAHHQLRPCCEEVAESLQEAWAALGANTSGQASRLTSVLKVNMRRAGLTCGNDQVPRCKSTPKLPHLKGSLPNIERRQGHVVAVYFQDGVKVDGRVGVINNVGTISAQNSQCIQSPCDILYERERRRSDSSRVAPHRSKQPLPYRPYCEYTRSPL